MEAFKQWGAQWSVERAEDLRRGMELLQQAAQSQQLPDVEGLPQRVITTNAVVSRTMRLLSHAMCMPQGVGCACRNLSFGGGDSAGLLARHAHCQLHKQLYTMAAQIPLLLLSIALHRHISH